MNVIPLADRILVELPEAVEKIGAIFIPDSSKEEKSEGIVRAVGYGKITDSGKPIPVRVDVGDKVLFGKYAGDDITVEDKKFKILREIEILAIVRE